MRFLVLALGAALMMGCAGGSSSSSGGLDAPTPHSITTRIGAADQGKIVVVAVGVPFAVELVGVPTAGYLWKPATTPAFLSVSGETGGPTTEAQRQPGFAGGNHWEVTIFTASAPGRGELKFEQRRPWEQNEPPADTFSVTIEAK